MSARRLEHARIMSALEIGLALVEELVSHATPGLDDHAGAGADAQSQLHGLNATRLRQLRHAVQRLQPDDARSVPLLHPALIARRRRVRWSCCASPGAGSHGTYEGNVLRRPRLVDMTIWAELNGAHLVLRQADPLLIRNPAQILQGFRGPQREHYVFVNADPPAARPPTDEPSSGRAALLSLPTDPLDYVGFRRLDLDSFHVVYRSARGHWQVDTVVDDTTLLASIGRLLASPPASVAWRVVGGQARFVIAHRLEQLHVLAHRVLAEPGAVFVLPFGARTVSVRRGEHGAVDVERHADLDRLRDYLRRNGCETVGFDPANQRLKALLRVG